MRNDVDSHWHVTATESYADNAATRAYNNATSWTASQGYASRDWVYQNYTPWRTYSGHTHHALNISRVYALTDWDTYNTSVGDVSHIKRTTDIGGLYTSRPA